MSRTAFILASALLSTAACLPPPTVEIRRSALAPAATPIARSGQPMGDNVLEANVSGEMTSTISAANNETGVAIPSTQARGEIRFRPPKLDNVDFGIGYLHIPRSGAESVADYPIPEEDGAGYTGTVHVSVPSSDGFNVGFGMEVAAYSLPFLVYERCIENCFGGAWKTVSEHRETVLGIGFGVIPSFRFGRFSISGQFAAKTHPDIDRLDVVESYVRIPEGPESGDFAMILGGGLEADLPAGFRLGAKVHSAITGPVRYGPVVSATLTIPLVREKRSPDPLR